MSFGVKVKVSWLRPTLRDPVDCIASPWDSPGQNTGMGSLFLVQVLFQTEGLNPGILHCRWILFQQSHKRSPCFGVTGYKCVICVSGVNGVVVACLCTV